MKRSPSCVSSPEGAPSPSGQSHSGERKCMGKRKGRKKHKDDFLHDPAITTDEVYDGIIALAATLMFLGSNMSKAHSDSNPAGPLKELSECTTLGALLFITMILLLRSGDVETNPGPVERGGWLCIVHTGLETVVHVRLVGISSTTCVVVIGEYSSC